MVKNTGAVLALLAFAVTIIAGVAVGNPATTTLTRALWAMAAFYLLGTVLGHIMNRVIDEYAIRRKKELFGEDDEASTASEPNGGTVSNDAAGSGAAGANGSRASSHRKERAEVAAAPGA